MVADERRDPEHPDRRRGVHAWILGNRRTASTLVAVMFVIMGVMAFGVTASTRVAQRALAFNQTARAQLVAISDENRQLRAEVSALRKQIEAMGAKPIEITLTTPTTTEPRRIVVTTRPPTTTAPAPATTKPTTTTTAAPCRTHGPRHDRCVTP